MHSGGDPHASAQSARVILADPHTEVFDHLVKTYQGVPEKYVESYLWVKKCIERGSVIFTPLVYKNPGGRRPGEERTQFTEEDEENLCQWIAAKIPYKETGGRTGNRLYQQLCDQSGDPEYAWAARHTWQSWRERYKKNAARLDAQIAAVVEQKRPLPGEKGQIGYVRQAEEKAKRNRKKRPKNEDSGLDGMEEFVASTPVPVPRPSRVPQDFQSFQGMQDGGTPFPQISPPSASTLDQSAMGRAAGEEEMDEEGTEWMIKIGSADPPTWGKRKTTDEETEEESGRKRMKPDEPSSSAQEASALNPQTLLAIANIHVIDQSINDIAKEFRFTVEEVQEYYDRCGEMGRTKERFQQMRQLLTAKYGDD